MKNLVIIQALVLVGLVSIGCILYPMFYPPQSASILDVTENNINIPQLNKYPVIDQSTNTGDSNITHRVTILKAATADSKMPYVRVEETVPAGKSFSDAKSVNRKVMLADSLIVKFKAIAIQADIDAVNQHLGATLKDKISPGLVTINFPYQRFQEVLDKANAEDMVEYAEPDYVVFSTQIPNDPSFSLEWGLNNTGQSGGIAGADIHAPTAWDATTGTGATVVAIIDTGIDYNHPDLQANIWTNPGEIPGNGIDDDHDGYIDDVYGWDFVNNDADPMDDNSHGTHVAGTIGAMSNNGAGVAGVDWNVKMMVLKFLDATGSGSTSNAIRALNFAVSHGATISNNSWGGSGYNQSLYDAISSSKTINHIFAAAAGNNATDNEVTPFYPASYNLDNVVSVAATDRLDQLASFSNYGATSVDLAAPGFSIYSTLPGNTYGYKSGTSMATPHVTGALALISDVNPTWTYTQVINQMLSTVTPLGVLAGKMVSGGRLNLAASLGVVSSPDTTAPTISITSPSNGAIISGAVNIATSALDNVGVTKVEFYADTTLLGTATVAPYTYSWDTTKFSNGTHTITAKAYDSAGNVGVSGGVSVNINNPDTTPPVVTISGPATVTTSKKTFTATASDNVGVSKVEFYLDSATTPFATVSVAPYTASVPVSGKNALSSGSHTIKAKAYDAGGNTTIAQMTFVK